MHYFYFIGPDGFIGVNSYRLKEAVTFTECSSGCQRTGPHLPEQRGMRSSSHKGDVLTGDLINHQQVAFGVAPAVVRRFGLQPMSNPYAEADRHWQEQKHCSLGTGQMVATGMRQSGPALVELAGER